MALIFHLPCTPNSGTGYKNETIGNSFTNIGTVGNVVLTTNESDNPGPLGVGYLGFTASAADRFDCNMLEGVDEFSIAAYLVSATTELESPELISIDMLGSDGDTYRWGLGLNSTNVTFYSHNHTDTVSGTTLNVSGGLSDGAYFIVFTYSSVDGITIRVWNSVDSSSSPTSYHAKATIPTTSYSTYNMVDSTPKTRITLGQDPGSGTSTSCNGVSDIRIYNHIISDYEIQQLLKKPLVKLSFDGGG